MSTCFRSSLGGRFDGYFVGMNEAMRKYGGATVVANYKRHLDKEKRSKQERKNTTLKENYLLLLCYAVVEDERFTTWYQSKLQASP